MGIERLDQDQTETARKTARHHHGMSGHHQFIEARSSERNIQHFDAEPPTVPMNCARLSRRRGQFYAIAELFQGWEANV